MSDPCSYCGVREHVGCKHQPALRSEAEDLFVPKVDGRTERNLRDQSGSNFYRWTKDGKRVKHKA